MRNGGFVRATSVALTLAVAAGTAAAQETMYGSTDNSSGGSIMTVSQADGSSEAIGDALDDGPTPAIAMDASGALYVSNNDRNNPAGKVGVLRRIDPADGTVLATIGTITDAADSEPLRITSMEFSPLNGALYGVSAKGDKEATIYRIDTATAVATAIGATGLKRGGLAFTPDGRLYLATAERPDGFTQPVIARIDPTTGAVIGTPVMLSDGTEIEGLAVRPSDGVFFGAYADGSDIFTIDPDTGLQVSIGSSSSSRGSIADLTFRPSPLDSVRGFLLPEKIRVKLNAKRPERSSFKASARLDDCCDGILLGDGLALHLGGTTFSLSGAKLNKKATRLVFSGEGLKVVLRTGLGGTSRGALSVKLKGDLTGIAEPDGTVALRLAGGDLDVSGTATLAGTRFDLRRGNAVDAAPLVPISVRGRVRDPDASSMTAKLALTTGEARPEAVPDVDVMVGTFRQFLSDELAEIDGERLVWTSRDPGVKQLVLDYARHEVTLVLADVTLGYSSGPLTIRIEIGGEVRSVTIVPRASGSSFTY